MKTIDQILKIKAVVLYILKAFPEGVDYIHLFKVMYFAQQNQLKEYGLPIIYDTFVARKHGPVPTLTYKVLRGVKGKAEISSPELKDFADSLKIELSQDGHQLILASKQAVCDMDELSVADVKMLDKWIDKCKGVDSFDLSDMRTKLGSAQSDKQIKLARIQRSRCMKWQMLQVPAKQCWPLFVSVNPFKRHCHGLKGSARTLSLRSLVHVVSLAAGFLSIQVPCRRRCYILYLLF